MGVQMLEHPYSVASIPFVVLSLFAICAILTSRWMDAGGRLNKKDGLTRYGDSHVKDKTS